MNKSKRVALYLRVSTSEQSTELQESELRRFASNRGWKVIRVYADTISGEQPVVQHSTH